MDRRLLGKSGIEIGPLAFGGNVFGWTLNEKRSIELLDAFTEAGFNFIDTADVYSAWAPGNQGGESETIIGNWLKKSGKRNQVLIATKLGAPIGDKVAGLSKTYMKQAVEASLRRLGVDQIDLYQSHYAPLEETMAAFNELVQEGKVRYLGASNLSADRIAEANQVACLSNWAEYVSIQPLYNLYDREGFEANCQHLVANEQL